ncbi:hypothetical protein BGZ65_012394 [Modicella reniformis]|uniref:Uncharacterized protein n=1 Tax=Modicella reniformis TaxID=1440133 RepID=A0A9P6IMZ8_9FUNG|nr:hypothetical protein BGZ65_012394 [Modicella reniformis]
MAKDRDLCCCCIKLRLAVAVISLLYLGIAAATTYQKYVANDTGNQTAKIIIFVSGGLQGLIALLGLLTAITKSVFITRTYAFLWWCLTLAVLGFSIASLYFVIKNDRSAIEDECRKGLKPVDGTEVGDDDVIGCYRLVIIISGVVLAVQFVIMCLFGWINQRFLREVKEDAAIASAVKAFDNEGENA